MPTPDWKSLDVDTILNDDAPQTAKIARYQRIMEQHSIIALSNVHAGLHDVKVAMHDATKKLDNRFHKFEQAQTKLQHVALALTCVIAISTVAYTWITWMSVQAQKEANQIQREALVEQPSKNEATEAQ